MTARIATGFACQPLPDGTVLIEFHDDGGEAINSQIVSSDAFRHLAFLVELTLAVVDVGAAAGADQNGGRFGRI